ncbi:MAG: rhomboid family intramembrane serine protease [Alphaproteobacteria bacterium]|nr:MAG: rhomboid family intramembrane serine protease [Alphaproteobacteria bacterium]
MNIVHPESNPTFAQLLSCHLVARRGYRADIDIPEFLPVVQACDMVLVRPNLQGLQIVVLVDGEADPDRAFALSHEELQACAARLRERLGQEKLVLSLSVIEIHARPVSVADRQRLNRLPCAAPVPMVTHVWHVDVTRGDIWTNMRLGGLLSYKPMLQSVWRRRWCSQDRLFQTPLVPIPARPGPPVLTQAMLIALLIVYVAELMLQMGMSGFQFSPDAQTLTAMGGLSNRAVLKFGEWHRLLTSTLLHGSVLHLIFNGIALYMAGLVLESILGRAWLFALFAIGGLAGALLSLTLNPLNSLSIGASGAIMALLAAAFIVSFRLSSNIDRDKIQIQLMQILIPSLLPLTFGIGGHKVDFSAHLGGALAGLAMGWALLAAWSDSSPHPPLRAVGMILAVLAGLAYGGSALAAVDAYQRIWSQQAWLADDKLMESQGRTLAQSQTLTERYPHDPRAHMFYGLHLLRAMRRAEAEQAFRTALEEDAILTHMLDPGLKPALQAALAATVALDPHRLAEARGLAQPVCIQTVHADIRQRLTQSGLCDSR